MSKGKRYETEGKLNYQKVFAVIIAIAVVIMIIFLARNVLKDKKTSNKINEYFSVYSANKWGVINQDGETIINPTYQEMIVVPDKEKDVFICVYNINEETGEYKTKALNSKNEEIFTQYDQIEPLENVDENDNLWYEENVLKVKKADKYGLIDLSGKEILPCEYENIEVLKGIENSLLITQEEKVGLVNDKGSIIIEPNYKEIKNLGETYKEGYITIDEQGRYGLISTTKKQILENNYEEIEQKYLQSYYLIKENGKLKLINSSGETIIEDGFDDIQSVTKRGIIFEKDKQYGEMDLSGEILIEPKYQVLKEAFENVYIAKEDDQYGIIDQNGEEKVPFEYTGLTYNEKANLFIAETDNYQTAIINSQYETKIEGILSEINTQKSYMRMRIDGDYKYYNFECEEKKNTEILKENTLFLSKKNGKYGYVDKKGNNVVDYIYDDGTEQNEYGYIAVKKNGLWGSLNNEGKEIIEPKYNLDNNLKINFLGKWHLGEDINMNYYCEK